MSNDRTMTFKRAEPDDAKSKRARLLRRGKWDPQTQSRCTQVVRIEFSIARKVDYLLSS